MKKILGLDLGTNSIGWALIDKEDEKILGMGSRIIPMGTDKMDYEKGVGVTKNADRRTARTIRKMNKRYKQRRNKLLFILNELGLCPNQFQFRHQIRDEKGKLTSQYKDGFPAPRNVQDLELLPIKRGTLQLDSLRHYELRVKSLTNEVTPMDFGKILYQFNQLRGYAGGSNKDDTKKKKEDTDDEESEKKKKGYEVIIQKVTILKFEQSQDTFKVKGGKNKGEEQHYFDVTFLLDDEEKSGRTMLQKLETGKEEELEIRIKQTKKGENIIVALPNKTDWKKQMEATEEIIKTEKISVGHLLLKDLQNSKWTKVRNRVILRNRYQEEFDKIWDTQAQYHPILSNCPDEKITTIINYLYPGSSETQNKLRSAAISGGLKYIIKEQVIYYQRELKPQTELIGECQFEKEEKRIPTSHPLFEEFRCWKQINQLSVTSKISTYDEKKKKNILEDYARYLTNEQKQELFSKLQNQKQIGFSEVAKIVGLKNDKTEFLNGLNAKAKLKGCETSITIKKFLGDDFQTIVQQDKEIVLKIWESLFNYNSGNEYDVKSKKVAPLINILKFLTDETNAATLALKLAQNINYPRKYASLSEKAISQILRLMRLNPVGLGDSVKENLEKIKYAIETGELSDGIELYMVDYISNNPNILETGGMMDSFAASLVYGKHTVSNIKPTIKNYHDIKYNPNRNLRNPIVEQITNEALQVIKAIWKEYQFNPDELEIRIELARDLKNSAAEREKIFNAQNKSRAINESIKERLRELKQEISGENIERFKIWSGQRESIEAPPKQSKEPTSEEIEKMRVWEDQKFISPYTLKPIPLSRLFTRDYDIDHIIPKTRAFDDSLSNKVVCETNINEEKSNRTAWEYMNQQVTKFQICSIESYLKNVNENYFGKKKKNLLLEKIPTGFVERQIKETQYIALAVKTELAQIVGSDNVKSSTGEVTSFLRSRWGLRKLFMELTESRFKQMELWDASSEWVKRYYDEVKKKNVYEIKNWSKRYDHRHHAIDALVVALTEQWHIQRLNNLNEELQDWLKKHKDEIKLEVREDETVLEAFFNLEENRRETIQKQIESFRKFDSPFVDLIKQAKTHLETIVVSHKPKDNLTIQFNEKTKNKELKIRSALHEETLYGKHLGRDTKTVELSKLTAKDIDKIVDEVLKKEIREHKAQTKYGSMKEAFTGEGLKEFNENRFQRKKPESLKPPVFKVKIYYSGDDKKESTLQRLYDDNEKLSVKTGGNYLFIVMEKENERVFFISSLYDAVSIAKGEWKNQSEDFKKRIYEHALLETKADKVLFSLQQNELVYLPENQADPVLNMTAVEFDTWSSIIENKAKFAKRIYKVVKFSGKDCYFIPNNYSSVISASKDLTEEQKKELEEKYGDKKIPRKELNFEEFGSYGISSMTEVNEHFVKGLNDKKYKVKPLKIQEHCIKIQTDWLGKIKFV